jgi:hypothetical protein
MTCQGLSKANCLTNLQPSLFLHCPCPFQMTYKEINMLMRKKRSLISFTLALVLAGCGGGGGGAGGGGAGPSDADIQQSLSKIVQGNVTVVRKRQCDLVGNDKELGVTERWLVVFRMENGAEDVFNIVWEDGRWLAVGPDNRGCNE